MKRFKSDIKRLKLLSTGFFGINRKSSRDTKNSLDDIFYYAGINEKEKQKLILRCIILSVCIFFISIFFFKFYISLFLVIAYLIIEYFLLNKKVILRAKNFEEDYPAFLISLASCVKSGKDPLQALLIVKDLFLETSILKEKLLDVLLDIQEGMSEEEAINNFAKDIKHPDIDLFKVAFILSRKEGSGLYKPLRRLTKVTRQRQSFRRKTQSAIAMQKVSAFGILGSGVFIAFIQMIMNREHFFNAISTPLGIRLMALGTVLVFIGIAWMLYLARGKI
ncbi:MAG: type II secretion system F family protein [Bdellovibrionota bacterium]